MTISFSCNIIKFVNYFGALCGGIAQLVEHSPFKRGRVGSNPAWRTMETFVSFLYGGVPKPVEGAGLENRKDGNRRKSSNLFAPAINRGVAQLVECLFWEQDAAGSSPVTSTNVGSYKGLEISYNYF